MRAFSSSWSPESGWSRPPAQIEREDVQLLLAFGPYAAPATAWFNEVKGRWPNATMVYGSGGGQIHDGEILDASVSLMGMSFESARVNVVSVSGAGIIPCEQLGRELGGKLADTEALRHVLVFVDGLRVNGAAFTRGLTDSLPGGVTVSGGLASDGTAFEATGVGIDGPPHDRLIVGVAFSGERLVVSTGSVGGWEAFGPERLVTKSSEATVYELDGERALDVYRRYLGDLAAELPGSALHFPLSMDSEGVQLVRTILGVDETEGSLRFAGDVPQGSKVRLMRSTNDRILDGAADAARDARNGMDGVDAQAVLCISCIGRREVLRSRCEEEIDEVAQFLPDSVVTGFYSNGEIAPPSCGTSSTALLHNQTMTITAFGER